MTRAQRVAAAVLGALILGGMLLAGPLAALRCAAPWIDAGSALLVTVPAVYTAVFLALALRDAGRTGPAASLYAERARRLSEAAGRLPPPLVYALCAGLALQVVLKSADLRGVPVCTAPAGNEPGIEPGIEPAPGTG